MNYQISRANNGWVLTYENPEDTGELKEVFMDTDGERPRLQSLLELFKYIVGVARLRPTRYDNQKLVIEIQKVKE